MTEEICSKCGRSAEKAIGTVHIKIGDTSITLERTEVWWCMWCNRAKVDWELMIEKVEVHGKTIKIREG